MFALSKNKVRFFTGCVVCCGLVVISLVKLDHAKAQQTGPVLISREDSTRAIAFDSVTRQREPFTPVAPVRFGNDPATRIMLFAMNLQFQPGETLTVEAEDVNHNMHTLTVEHVGDVPDQPWATSIIIKLNETMPATGDVLVRLKYQGFQSNRVRVGIGQIGGGLPDDPNSVPTPGTQVISIGPPVPKSTNLTADDVRRIIAQAASAALSLSKPVTIIVTDREANVLGFFPMSGGPSTTTVRSVGAPGKGLEGASVLSSQAAISKAATAAFFSTHGNAFSTRTAGFIIQEHFPPGINFRPAGPLYGVQFSSLPCGDINRISARLGLSGDPGGLPIYKNGEPAGGIGIEGDGVYTVDRTPTDSDTPFEELIAASAVRGFEAPALIRGDNILVDGIRLPYSNVTNPPAPPTVDFGTLTGAFIIFPPGGPDSQFTPQVVGGITGEVSTRFFPFIAGTAPAGSALSAAEVNTIISRAAQQANITRAAIRQPLGSNARVTIAVVDPNGVVLGIFRQQDAPIFGFDVAVQKARTAAFFSSATAGARLRAAGFGSYVDRALADGVRLDGSIAFSDRATGFLHRPFFPDGLDDTAAGPLSTPISEWSPFNVGLQLDLVKANFVANITPPFPPFLECTSIPGLANGIQVFAGSVPLYRNGVLVGAIGISGDGIDQDDLIAAAGASGFSPPAAIRSDQVFVRGVRLPFLKFPRSPNL